MREGGVEVGVGIGADKPAERSVREHGFHHGGTERFSGRRAEAIAHCGPSWTRPQAGVGGDVRDRNRKHP